MMMEQQTVEIFIQLLDEGVPTTHGTQAICIAEATELVVRAK